MLTRRQLELVHEKASALRARADSRRWVVVICSTILGALLGAAATVDPVQFMAGRRQYLQAPECLWGAASGTAVTYLICSIMLRRLIFKHKLLASLNFEDAGLLEMSVGPDAYEKITGLGKVKTRYGPHFLGKVAEPAERVWQLGLSYPASCSSRGLEDSAQDKVAHYMLAASALALSANICLIAVFGPGLDLPAPAISASHQLPMLLLCGTLFFFDLFLVVVICTLAAAEIGSLYALADSSENLYYRGMQQIKD